MQKFDTTHIHSVYMLHASTIDPTRQKKRGEGKGEKQTWATAPSLKIMYMFHTNHTSLYSPDAKLSSPLDGTQSKRIKSITDIQWEVARRRVCTLVADKCELHCGGIQYLSRSFPLNVSIIYRPAEHGGNGASSSVSGTLSLQLQQLIWSTSEMITLRHSCVHQHFTPISPQQTATLG